MVLSKFENLPPELMVEISDYLDGCDLYNAFSGLNQRMDAILDQQCHRLCVNFTRVSKIKFDLCCNRILLRMSSRIVALTLNGDNSSTPGQHALFLSRFPSLAATFTKLESFRLIDFTKMDVQLLIPQLSTLIHLKCLSIGDYQRLMPFNITTEELFHENVLLPISLRRLSFPYEISNLWTDMLDTRKSFVEQAHVHSIYMNSLFSFLQKFPHLKRLTAVLSGIDPYLEMASISQNMVTFDKLRYLNINVTHTVLFDDFARFLSSVPQLHSLSLEALNPDATFFEAHRWETALPLNLSSFRFDLTMTLPNNPNHLELLQPFKSHFWISRSWFVQCHLRDHGRFFRFSTTQSPIITILHWPDDEVLLGTATPAVYPKVTHIELWWNLSKSTQAICPNVRSIQFYGARDETDEPIHPNVCNILQHSSFEHLIINDNLPITQIRFASTLLKSSDHVHRLTCSTRWLRTMLEDKRYEWICFLLTIRIRKLILISDETVLSHTDLIAFCRTFINLQELTMKVESGEDLFFLLNTLGQLTMTNIELPSHILETVTDITQWIQENTILIDFVVRKQILTLNLCKLTLWISSRGISNSIILTNYLRDAPWVNQALMLHENF